MIAKEANGLYSTIQRNYTLDAKYSKLIKASQ